MRGPACPLQLTGGPAAHLRAGRPRSQEPLRSAPFPGTAGFLPASTHRWACGPLAGGTPALPGTPAPLGAFPGTAGGSPASTHRWALGPLAGGSPAIPGTTPPLGAFPGTAGGSPASTHRWALGPLAGGSPAIPGTTPPLGAFPRDRGRLARFYTTVGLPPTCGRAARAPRNPSARCLSRDRGRLARFNTPVGPRPTCGRVARAPRGTPPLGAFPRDRGRLARFNTPVGLPPTCGRAARAPRNPSVRRLSLGPRAACPPQLTGGPAAHLRAGRPRSQEPLRSAPFPGTAGGSPASTHRWACGPLAGGSPALPGTPPLGAFPGTAGSLPASTHRWACRPLQLTGGPAAHLRAGRPRSQEEAPHRSLTALSPLSHRKAWQHRVRHRYRS